MMNGNELNTINSELIFIKFNNLEDKPNIQNFYKSFNTNMFCENKVNKSIMIWKPNQKQFNINDFWNKLNKEYNIYDFSLYLIIIDNDNNELKTKVTSINFLKKIEVESNYYICLTDFLNNHLDFKNLFNNNLDNFINTNKVTNNLQIKINKFFTLDTDLSEFLNLFLLFGNIKDIYFDYWQGVLYLNYESIKSINRIIDCKSEWMYYDKLIDISISSFKKKKVSSFIKIIKFNKNINLFNKNFLKIKYNSPNNKIIICNITNEVLDFNLYKIISQYGEPLLFKFVNKKNKNTKMCIIQFERISESINVIINMNNKTFYNNRLKISFTFNDVDL